MCQPVSLGNRAQGTVYVPTWTECYHVIGYEVEKSQQFKTEESSVSAGSALVPRFSLVKNCPIGRGFPYTVDLVHLPFLEASEVGS